MSHDHLIELTAEVSINIVNHPEIQKVSGDLFNRMMPDILARIDEIKTVVTADPKYFEFADDGVMFYFYCQAFKEFMSKAVHIAFNGGHEYNLLQCLKTSITEENLRHAIYGECMIECFILFIQNLPEKNGYLQPLKDTDISLIRKKFLNK